MIVTLTPNPSIDVTLHVDTELSLGGVNRAATVTNIAGGKGVNVSRVVHYSERSTLALYPASPRDVFTTLLNDTGVTAVPYPIEEQVRTNTTLTEPDGRTTKINGPGPMLTEEDSKHLLDLLYTHAQSAQAVVLAGSLPPGLDNDFYSRALKVLAKVNHRLLTAVDTSGSPMIALGENFTDIAPDIIKPNGYELGELTGCDGAEIEELAENGDFRPAVQAATKALKRGVKEILVTLGGAGAVLVTTDGAWHAAPPPITVRSTVGAGDSSLAGYLLARLDGASFPDCLRQAVAYGSAAAALPGTVLPQPAQINTDGCLISSLPTTI